MSSSRPKEPAEKKAGSKAKASPPPVQVDTPPVQAAVRVDGAERARLNRLAAGGWSIDRCALLGIGLDVGPRASRWQKPVQCGDAVMSELAAVIVESGVSHEALELAATCIREAPPEALEFAATCLCERGES